jgi:hypothetical protein
MVHSQVTNEIVGYSDVCLGLLKELSQNSMMIHKRLGYIHKASLDLVLLVHEMNMGQWSTVGLCKEL